MSGWYDPGSRYAVGVDIGGTKINIGVLDEHGNVLIDHHLPTVALTPAIVPDIVEGIRWVLNQLRERHPDVRIKGIGVGSAGQIEVATGKVHAVADYRCSAYVGTSIKERLHRTFEVPVIVDNDVNVLAVAEKYFGAGIGTKHLLCLTLGTGIGGAMLIGGKLVHGAWGGAGEFGHISVDFRGETCHCGGVGCVELYASGTGIARRMQLKSGLDSPDTRQVVERWLEGDACATEVMEEAIQALGTALMSLIHAFNPEKIVIGGGLSEIGAPLFARLQEEVTRRTMPVFRESLQIQPAYKLNKGNMIGAAMMILKDDWKE